jgi:hypothetical protein
MKRHCRWASACFVQTVIYIFILQSSFASYAAELREDDAKAEGKEHPGYFQQWREMKSDRNGRIPRGMNGRWYKHDERIRKLRAATPLEDVIRQVKYIGPFSVGGRTRTILVDSANERHLLAGAISGGLWSSLDAGANWSPLNDAAVNLMVSCLTQNPLDARIIYYGTGEARANSAGVPGEGVFKSTNGGKTFRQLPATANDLRFTNCWCIAHSATDASTVFVGTEDGLLVSRDAGTTWTIVLATPEHYDAITDVLAFADGSVLAASSQDGLYHSRTGAAGTFAKINSSAFPASFVRIEVANCEDEPEIVYAAFEDPGYTAGANGLCVSRDGGLTWNALTVPRTGPIYARYCFTLGVHHADPNRLICGGRDLKYSTDGGRSWRSMGYSHADNHCVVNLEGSNHCLIGNDGGVYRYDWAMPEAAPVDLNDGYHVTQFYAGDFGPSGQTCIGGTQDNGTWKITGGPDKKVFGNDGAHCHISLQDADLAYCSYQNGRMLRSENFTDANPNWTPISTNSDMNAEGYWFINPFQINYADGKQLFCCTNKAIWRTTDAGTSWNAITRSDKSFLYAVGCSRAANPRVYCAGARSLYRIDSAKTAKPGDEVDLSDSIPISISGDFIACIAVHPGNAGTIFVGISQIRPAPRIWRVSAADTPTPVWTDVGGDLPPELPVNYISVDPSDPNRKMFVGTDFGLYYTTNAGANWSKHAKIPNVAIHETKLRASDRSLFLFTHGRGVWQIRLH